MLPRPLAPSAIRRIIAEMPVRDRLVVEWAVTTGIRRMEIAGLKLRLLPKACAEPMMPAARSASTTWLAACSGVLRVVSM